MALSHKSAADRSALSADKAIPRPPRWACQGVAKPSGTATRKLHLRDLTVDDPRAQPRPCLSLAAGGRRHPNCHERAGRRARPRSSLAGRRPSLRHAIGRAPAPGGRHHRRVARDGRPRRRHHRPGGRATRHGRPGSDAGAGGNPRPRRRADGNGNARRARAGGGAGTEPDRFARPGLRPGAPWWRDAASRASLPADGPAANPCGALCSGSSRGRGPEAEEE